MRLLTIKQVSEMLQTNPAFIYKLIDAGRLRAIWLQSLKSTGRRARKIFD